MRTMYCIFQNGSNPAYRKGIIAVCTSLRKAIKIIEEKYEYDLRRLKPTEHNLTINGKLTYYRLDDNANNAWMKVEITEEPLNRLIR